MIQVLWVFKQLSLSLLQQIPHRFIFAFGCCGTGYFPFMLFRSLEHNVAFKLKPLLNLEKEGIDERSWSSCTKNEQKHVPPIAFMKWMP